VPREVRLAHAPGGGARFLDDHVGVMPLAWIERPLGV
jgi:hypothetical protein